MATNSTTKQEKVKQKKTLKNGNPINEARQFGKPNGNPRHNGAWKKTDSPRWKLEQMMKLTAPELHKVAIDKEAPLFERKLAKAIEESDWKVVEQMVNQVYGMPKQSVETVDLTPPKPLSPRKQKK